MIYRLGLDSDRAAWERAVERAIGHNYPACVTFDAAAQVEGFEVGFLVKSAWTPGKTYFVQLLVKDDRREAVCDCVADNLGTICCHMAAAALVAGLLTLPDPEPEPVEAMKKLTSAEFTISDILSGAYREALMTGTLA